VGEMAGRPEGGNVEHDPISFRPQTLTHTC